MSLCFSKVSPSGGIPRLTGAEKGVKWEANIAGDISVTDCRDWKTADKLEIRGSILISGKLGFAIGYQSVASAQAGGFAQIRITMPRSTIGNNNQLWLRADGYFDLGFRQNVGDDDHSPPPLVRIPIGRDLGDALPVIFQ